MSRQLRIGCDVDGVLANFQVGYLAALKEVSGGKECELHRTHLDPKCWYWPTEYGYTQEEDDKAWELIKDSPLFWFTLPPLFEADAALDVLKDIYACGHEVYFITNRPGIHPHLQTCGWLSKHGYPTPNVLVTDDKGPVAKGLKLTHFIDDKFSNCRDVATHTHNATRVFMLKKNYNLEHLDQCKDYGIEVVNSLAEFFEAIANEEKAVAIAG